jgi:hypothetical protein
MIVSNVPIIRLKRRIVSCRVPSPMDDKAVSDEMPTTIPNIMKHVRRRFLESVRNASTMAR